MTGCVQALLGPCMALSIAYCIQRPGIDLFDTG